MQQVAGLRGDEHVHIIGIGGAGMSGVARVLLERGHPVSGSDLQDGPVLQDLVARGARVYVGHSAEHVQGAEIVAATSAAPPDNPEIVEARRLGLAVWHRGEMLRSLIEGRRCVAIAGVHGKTTTTAMIALLLRAAGLEPSFIVGGVIPGLGSAHTGRGVHFVVEADEYDRTFLELRPDVAVVTNVEWEHVDCYPDGKAIRRAFGQFVSLVPPEGAVFVCQDDAGARESARSSSAPVWSYGLSSAANWQASDLRLTPQGTTFTVLREEQPTGRFNLRIPGKHNVLNALAALAVASLEGVDPETAGGVLARFAGVERRFQQLGSAQGITVVDDYAHHPSEVRATLCAAQQRFPDRRIVAVFQPHTYSRTRAFGAILAEALSLADRVVVTRIYAARETDPGGLSGEEVAAQVTSPAIYAESLEEAFSWLLEHLQSGDVLLTLGAGDITLLGPRLLSRFSEQGA